MAFSHGASASVFSNGYDLTAYFNSFEGTGQNEPAETTTFGNTAKTYIPGVSDGNMKAEGLFDATAGASGDKLNQAIANRAVTTVCYWPEGDTLGNRGVGLAGHESAYDIKSDVSDANKVSAEFQSSVGREGITSHRAVASSTAAGTATVIDHTTGSTGHAVGYLQVTGATSGTVTVKLQDSADNSSYTDLITFTAITSSNAPFAERLEASGTVRRYTRAVWSGAGTATWGVALGRYGN